MITSEVRSPRAHAPIHRWLVVFAALAGCTSVPASTTQQGEDNGTGDTETQAGNALGDADGDEDVDADEDEAPFGTGDQDAAGDGDFGDAEDPGVAGEDCADEAAAAQAVLDQNCVSCHGNGDNDGGFGNAENIDRVVANGDIVLGDLGRSEVYEVSESGEMPLNSSNLSDAELAALEAFILCVPDDGDDIPPAGGGGNVGGGDDDDDDQEVDDDNDDDNDDDDNDDNDDDDDDDDDDDEEDDDDDDDDDDD